MKKVSIIIGIIIILIAGFFIIKPKDSNSQEIVLGFVGPITGPIPAMGQNTRNATELAVEQINAKGGINGNKIKMIYEDGKCDGKASTLAFNKLISQDKVIAIVGGLCSGETLAGAPISEKNKIPTISPGSSSPKITDAGDYIFRTYPSDIYQGKVASEFIAKDLGAKKVAIMNSKTDWSEGIKAVFKDNITKEGVSIVAEESFAEDTKDLKSQILKIKSTNPDVIYFLGYTSSTAIGIKQARELGITAKFVGGDAWSDPEIAEVLGKNGEDLMFLQVKSPTNEAFKTAMAQKTNSTEITSGSANAYDATKILAKVIEKVGTDREKIKNELYNIKNYDGVSGNISFDKNGDLEGASYEIVQIKDGKPVVIK